MTTSAIADYALIGDLHTAALVGRDGSIDWMCVPRFDSPACFAALLHDDSAGRWRLCPAELEAVVATRRSYRQDTLVLDTEWDTATGSVRVTDFMPPREQDGVRLVRMVTGLRGRMSMDMRLVMRFDYGHVKPWVRHHGNGLTAVAGPDALYLDSSVPVHGRDDASIAEFDVTVGQVVTFVLRHQPSNEPDAGESTSPMKALSATEDYWRSWIAPCRYDGQWQPAVRRALITLKALTYAPTGGIVAAATTSLPESPGGSRNWDYRYCWLRDTTFTLQAMLSSGYVDEAKAWREWLVRSVAGDPADLQIMYSIDGTRRVPELTLDWLDGCQGATPVRIGNAAAGQFQLDVWGEVLDSLHLARDAGLAPQDAAWDVQRALLDFLEGNWREKDSGLWEMRGSREHFVHSKVMAWVGVDRGVRAVEHHGLAGPIDAWRKLRGEIHDDVCAHGYDAERSTFTQYYGSRGLDAALLLIPRVGFLPSTDPRVVGTVRAVARDLDRDGLLLRYRGDDGGSPDGLAGTEGAFLACSFWMVDALFGIGERVRARELFDKLLGLRNDVGLLSEEYDTTTGELVGNTPQAFSMVGLINSAQLLSRRE